MILKSLPGNARYVVSHFQKDFFQNIEHSKNERVSSFAMEMPLAKAYLKALHIMEWVNSLNSFENYLYSTRFIWLNVYNNYQKYFN